MSIGEDINRAAELVAPEFGIAEWAVKLIAAIAVGGFIVWAFWSIFFAGRQAEAKHDAVAAHAQQLVGQAEGNAGAAAANTVANNAAKEANTHEITRDHYVYINQQPGAGDPVSDPVWNAFVSSVCVRTSAAGLPDCQRLREADSK